MGLLSLEHGKGAERADFLLYGVAIGALALVLGWRSPPAQAWALTATAVSGAAAWTLIEYGLHRVVLHHVPPFQGWHARHHSQPRALIGLPTLLSAALFAVFVYAPAWAWAGAWQATAFTLGVLIGYLAYAAVHHAVHHTHDPGPWLRQRRRWHALHHRPGGGGMAFGVTSAFWDRVFRSTAPAGVLARPLVASPPATTPLAAARAPAPCTATRVAGALPPPRRGPPPPGVHHMLALNCGSSSLKFGLYRVSLAAGTPDLACLASGEAEGLDGATPAFHAQGADGRSLLRPADAVPGGARDVVRRIAHLLSDAGLPAPDAIGHRIVHGGPGLRAHCRISPQVVDDLVSAAVFAPLHAAAALAAIGDAVAQFPGLPQVACLDTCFHAGMPAVARTLPLPQVLRAAGIERYGFHGLSCASIVRQLGSALPGRLLIAHLGNGASITAVRNGVSIDTSMGLTPTGGLPMGSRSGNLDPGVLVHLMRQRQFDAAAIEDLVDHRSGLLGVSGLSSDMRVLHQAAGSQPDARLAIDLFCYAVAKELGAMAVALGGVDRIVFTGGIGEHDSLVRSAVCARLASLGVALDAARNSRGTGVLTRDGAACVVQVLPAREDEEIALHTWALCGLATTPGSPAP